MPSTKPSLSYISRHAETPDCPSLASRFAWRHFPGAVRPVERTWIRLVTLFLAILFVSPGLMMLNAEPLEDGEETTVYDFATASQRDRFVEAPEGMVRRYPYSPTSGVGGVEGRLLSLNRGDQAQALFHMASTYDVIAAPASFGVKFQYGVDDNAEEGSPLVLLALANGLKENLVSGRGKLGMRVVREAKPEDPSRPWRFQLVNSTATRSIGEPFAMEDGNWYGMEGTFTASPDGKAIKFEIRFSDMGPDGLTPGEVQRASTGGTTGNTQYDLRNAMIGILGQHAGGGAVAFDDLRISSAASATPLRPVTFLPGPLEAGATVPTETMFGVCGHVIHTSRFYEGKDDYWTLEYTLPFLLDADLGWVREAIYQPWFANRERKDVDRHRADLERYLSMYEKHGVKVMLAIMAVPPRDRWVKYNDDFFDYVAELAARFDCVKVVEMHNEPNLKFFFSGTPREYVELYGEAARKVRAARPDIVIAAGSISSLWWEQGVQWMDEMIAAGGLEWADAISVHPYNKKAPPETDPHFTGAPEEDPNHMDLALDAWWARVREAAPDKKDLKLYFTEFGYSSADEGLAGIGSEERQADYLSRLMMIFLDARLRGIPLEGVFWYDLKDDGPKRTLGEHNFGLIRHDLSRVKPGYPVYAAIAERFPDPADLERLDLGIDSLNLPGALKTYSWRRKSDGALILPFWRLPHLQEKDVDFPTRLDMDLPDDFAVGQVVLHTLRNGHDHRPVAYTVDDDRMSIPLYVGDRVQWLVIHPEPEENDHDQ